MDATTGRGVAILAELTRRLALITPDQFQAPDRKKPPRTQVVGMATDYQKALVTLQSRVEEEHVKLHLEEDLQFGGHINLPFEHEFLHAAPELLWTLLTVNLSNTFKELSADVDIYISPDWRVCVVKPPIKPRERKAKYNPLN